MIGSQAVRLPFMLNDPREMDSVDRDLVETRQKMNAERFDNFPKNKTVGAWPPDFRH